MRFLPVNLDALLVELNDLDETLALFDALMAEPIAGVEEIIPAARTLLIQFRPSAITQQALVNRIASQDLSQPRAIEHRRVDIPVHYNGEDLEEVATLLGISRAEVVQRHTAHDYSVAFCGFAPGFAYLTGGAGFQVPRRQTPRTRIPAGAVALAGEFSGVYPQASPGGWQIIGVTPLQMWDLNRAEPALLRPGYKVRFTDAGPLPAGGLPAPAAQPPAAAPSGAYLHILSPGLHSTLQDLGRPGQTGQGVSRSGALDLGALRAANRAVGNPSDMACVETVLGGLSFVCHGRTVIAITGAQTPITITTASGLQWPAAHYQPIELETGDKVSLGSPAAGLRSYLAIRGGFQVKPVLGSLSTDTLAQVGPPALAAGDQLGFTTQTTGTSVSLSESPAFSLPTTANIVTLDVVMGPRTDWFSEDAIALLSSQLWRVTPQSNRVGIRLAGETPLTRSNHQELPSEGTCVGAIQVPASGQPVLFLADHPLTGGYPVIGAVASYHLDLAGQIPINAQIRFNPVDRFNEFQANTPASSSSADVKKRP
ncbi:MULTISPECIES: 5-oxoprolinase/urea amidolyase family protein [Pseudomonas]|uniref:5-oxoprolinase subunit B/C family protein n=1 Tax=Pseudomonas TaxID=286 RepID=UPI000CEB4B68|nr:5-oxoprolinase/urea amidolyase family protein [Pseudomonas monteilii]AVH38190.1 allophanate hydrolase [Pseudomonas monteilii]MBH3377765.1 5-oxoprolinase/urea amidolyase family protein [Pseudomonas asiatica]MBR7519400.1 5-oxoprolinase/urea amidolyase family protein [Pseudomonas juntendi]